MKEKDFDGLKSLKLNSQNAHDLREQALNIIREALVSAGLVPDNEEESANFMARLVQTEAAEPGECGFCTTCITPCVASCTFHVAG